jgi:hypothetical protein
MQHVSHYGLLLEETLVFYNSWDAQKVAELSVKSSVET